MTIDPEKLLALQIPSRVQSYGWRETALYALGLGFGIDPMDDRQLRFVDETRLTAFPTMANVLAHPGFWMRELDTGIDWVRVVHGEQRMQLHRPLPTEARVIGHTRVVAVIDKGAGKGALVNAERVISDADTGELYATLVQTTMCRGDGGFTAKSSTAPAVPVAPAALAAPVARRPPDHSVDIPTHAQLALIYRLSGDLNPLHADPAVARRAGYPRPIYHGLGTFGVAAHALIATLCNYQVDRVQTLQGRFSAPVFPGEIITIDIWDEGGGRALFDARIKARDTKVMSNGIFTHGPASSRVPGPGDMS
jgi:acyl dehydratase